MMINDDQQDVAAGDYVTVERTWAVGDHVRLVLPLEPRITTADSRIDAVRGSVAVEYGPLVYAFEQADQASGVCIDTAQLDPDAASTASHRPELLGGVSMIRAAGRVGSDSPKESTWAYAAATESSTRQSESVELVGVPYYAWANRDVGAMRVWLPISSA